MKSRPSSVAGMFYPRDPDHLEQVLEKYYRNKSTGFDAKGIVAPHAGYVYSGEVAATAYAAIPESFAGTFVIIGPSHRGYLTCTSAIPWETPLGLVDVDKEFVKALDIHIDEESHRTEHSIEVQLPFIKYRFPRAQIVPLMMGEQSSMSARNLAGQILSACAAISRDVRLVASSDFSHYIPHEIAKKQDLFAIEALQTLDVDEFYRRIEAEGVSACGYGPISSVALAAKAKGAREGRLLEYRTSGEITGEFDQVVGYGAIAVI
ncbi:MAG: AmmeMemoRadiSam system protein B [Methanomicrobiales archaeon]|nr:AmmeMemoRadiSam system protein B [Methanomicrobiales archaeon]